VRLGLVSAKYPFGPKEPYLHAELRALAPALDGIVVFPTSPNTTDAGFTGVPGDVVRLPLAGLSTFALAARAFVHRPWRACGAINTLLCERYPWRVKLKNLAVIPKGLALAEIVRERRLDHLHAYWLSTPATVAWIAARVAGIPFSATAHRWDVYENNLAARKVRDAAFVRTISERGRRDLLQRTGGDPEKVQVVRLGVELPVARRVRVIAGDSWGRLPAADRPLRILCAAALVPVKGHAVLLSALALLRARGVAFACTLAGDGPLRSELATLIARDGLADSVKLAGTVAHDELLTRLERGDYDVSVIASVEQPGGLMEGVPVALIEAMAAGTAVVAADSGSVGELVDGTTGLLVAHSDPVALADALARIANDPALREKLADTARARVERDFDVTRTAAALYALLSRDQPRTWQA
jgi:colanic acid/amylovoran biosynthesis glycosyltransferase